MKKIDLIEAVIYSLPAIIVIGATGYVAYSMVWLSFSVTNIMTR